MSIIHFSSLQVVYLSCVNHFKLKRVAPYKKLYQPWGDDGFSLLLPLVPNIALTVTK